MQGAESELNELMRTQNKRSQIQCYTAIHLTIGFMLFFAAIAAIAAAIIAVTTGQMWMKVAVWSGAAFFGFLTLLMLAMTDFLASTVWWFVMMAFGVGNILLILLELKHFYGNCDKDYCMGWQWDVFIVYFVFIVLNLAPTAVILYFLWRIWVLEGEDNKLARPKAY